MNVSSLKFNSHTISKSTLGKATSRIILFLGIMFSCHLGQAQNVPEAPIVFKNWLILGESKDHLDVSYRVVRCDNVNKVELKVISENNVDGVIHCKVVVINQSTGEKVTQEINLPIVSFKTLSPTCGSDNPYPDLKIELPASFDPKNINAVIIF